MPPPHVEIGEVGSGRRRKRNRGSVVQPHDRRIRRQQIRLRQNRDDALVFREHAVGIAASRRDQERSAWRVRVSGERLLVRGELRNVRDEMKTGCVERRAAQADDITRLGLDTMGEDVVLFVPVGIEQHPALLQPHAAVVSFGAERESGEVAFHGGSPDSVRFR